MEDKTKKELFSQLELDNKLSHQARKADAFMIVMELEADCWDFRNTWEYYDDIGLCPTYDYLMYCTEKQFAK